MLRPWQLRASAAEAALMIPAAARLAKRYRELRVPLKMFAGAEDRVANVEHNSVRLHRDVQRSELRVLPGSGHMIHYSAQNEIVQAVEALARSVSTIEHQSA